MGQVLDINQVTADMAEMDRQRDEAEAKEKLLRPFNSGNAPYNRERVIHEALFFKFHHVQSGYELGKRCVLLKEHESASTLTQIIEERLRISQSSFQRYERIARIGAMSPAFTAIFDKPGMVNRGLALMAGFSDAEVAEEMKTFEATGELLGMGEAELRTKTLKELQRENRRLRKANLTAAEKAQREKDRLEKKLEDLEAGTGATGLKESLKLLAQGEEKITDGMATLAKADCELLAKDAGAVTRFRLLIDKVRRVADFIEGSVFSAAKARQETAKE